MRAYAFIPFLLSLCGCVVAQPAPISALSSAPRTVVGARTVASGERQRIGSVGVLYPDCTTAGYATVRIMTPPVHGELTLERGVDYIYYPKGDQRSQCVGKYPVMNVYYQSSPGYVGADVATVEWVGPIVARADTITYMITLR